jgi:hypothetical protein
MAIPMPAVRQGGARTAHMSPIRAGAGFQYGDCAWPFGDGGKPKAHLPADVERRRDPRCNNGRESP